MPTKNHHIDSEAQDRWHHVDLTKTIQAVIDQGGSVDDIAAAVEDWCLDPRFSGREKWLRFNAWRRRGVHT